MTPMLGVHTQKGLQNDRFEAFFIFLKPFHLF